MPQQQSKTEQLRAIQRALATASQELDPRTQAAIAKAGDDIKPFWEGKIDGIKRNDTIIRGIPDDAEVMASPLDPPAMEAVARIPPALARALGKQLVSHLPNGKMKRVFSALQKKYPRLMGHVRQIKFDDPDFVFSDVGYSNVTGTQTSPIRKWDLTGPNYNHFEDLHGNWPEFRRPSAEAEGLLAKDVDGTVIKGKGYYQPNAIYDEQLRFFHPEEADHLSDIWVKRHSGELKLAESAAHELAHAAQQLRMGRKFTPNYREANRLVGYYDNPYEQFARDAGDNFRTRYAAEKMGITTSATDPTSWVFEPKTQALDTALGVTKGKQKFIAKKILPSGKTRSK